MVKAKPPRSLQCPDGFLLAAEESLPRKRVHLCLAGAGTSACLFILAFGSHRTELAISRESGQHRVPTAQGGAACRIHRLQASHSPVPTTGGEATVAW